MNFLYLFYNHLFHRFPSLLIVLTQKILLLLVFFQLFDTLSMVFPHIQFFFHRPCPWMGWPRPVCWRTIAFPNLWFVNTLLFGGISEVLRECPLWLYIILLHYCI